MCSLAHSCPSALGMDLPEYSTWRQGCAYIILTDVMFGMKTYKSKSQLKIKLPCDGTEHLAVGNCDSRLLCTWLLQGVLWPPNAHCNLCSHTSTRAQKRSVKSKRCTHRSTHFLRFQNLCVCFCGALSQSHRQKSIKSTTTFWILALGLKLKANPAGWTQS